jgi:hypothetical protein
MKYGGELSMRWKCGKWFERIDDGNGECDLTGLPESTRFHCRKVDQDQDQDTRFRTPNKWHICKEGQAGNK